jgi:hypothetical protein
MGQLKTYFFCFVLIFTCTSSKAQTEELDSLIDGELEFSTEPSVGPSFENVAEVNFLLIEARKHMATPYRSGGKSPGGFDCSGFVRHCYSSTLGIVTPASSSEYNKYGRAVSIDDCRPGDIICFKGHRRGSKRIGHVGIITEISNGNIFFIHSANRGGIRYDQLNAPYYKSRFVGIKRIIP